MISETSKLSNKSWLLMLAFLSLTVSVKADQLAYLTQKQAKKACAKLSKEKVVYLFCGCCDADIPEKARITDVAYRFTDYEMYYEVLITYQDVEGDTKSTAVDLAYVWVNNNQKIQTAGAMMKLKHDPCKPLDTVNWE